MAKDLIQQAKEDAEKDVSNGEYHPYSSSNGAIYGLLDEKLGETHDKARDVYEKTWQDKTSEKNR